MVFMTSMSALPHLKSGNPHPIAVASLKRLSQLPDVPTFAESGFPGFEAQSWNGLFAPAKTPPEIIARLNAEVNKVLTATDVRENLASQGAVVVGGSSADFRQYVGQEVTHWGKLLKTLKVSMD
jgi:tripartite-type tricarboxylate transporter receptor subunit TctC